MTQTSKNILLTVVVILIVIAAGFAYVYSEKHMKQQHSVAVQQQAPKWIDVDPKTSGFPPEMITGAPVSGKGIVVYDRYYVDSTGALHGEYTFDLPLTAQHGESDLYMAYVSAIQMNKNVAVKSQTPSLITISQPGYSDATIGFTSPSPQTVRVDINYVYPLSTKK